MTTPPTPSRPRVSVVVPTYNRAAVVGEAIESVLAQTVPADEIIVVDDGSTDDTPEVLARFGEHIRVIRHECNKGGAAARNTGVRHTTGTLIAFQDSDDAWLPRKLEKQLRKLEATGSDCVGIYCGMIVIEPHRATEGRGRTRTRYVPPSALLGVEGDILPALLATSFVSTQTLVVRRDSLDAVGGFDESLPALQDWDLVLRLVRTGPLAFVDEPLVIQHFSPNSITHGADKRVRAHTRIMDKNRDVLVGRPAVLAKHHRVVAGGLRRLGETAPAVRYLQHAIRLQPWDVRLWLALALSLGQKGSQALKRLGVRGAPTQR